MAFGISASTDAFTKGVTATKAELRDLKGAFLAAQTPVDKFSTQIEHLENLATKFPDKAGVINSTISKLRTEMSQAQFAASAFGSVVSKIGLNLDPVSAAFKVLDLAAGAARMTMAAFSKVADEVSQSMERIAETSFAADKLGISDKALVGLRGAGEDLANVTGEAFDSALSKFAGGIGEAAMKGTGPASDALARLGLDPEKLSSMGVDQQLMAVAEAMEGIENINERLALSKGLLGKSGDELAPMLAAGAERIRELADEQNLLSQTEFIDSKSTREAIAAMRDLDDALKGIVDVFTGDLAPLVSTVSKDLVGGLSDAANQGNTLRDSLKQVSITLAEVVDSAGMLAKFGKGFAENSPIAWLGGARTAGLGISSTANSIVPGMGTVSQGGFEIGNAIGNWLEKSILGDSTSHTSRLIESQKAFENKAAPESGPAQAAISANADQQSIDKAAKDELDFRVMEQRAMMDIATAVEQAKERELKVRDQIADDLQRQMDAVNKEIATKGEQLADSLKTPAEKLRDDFEELQANRGQIGEELFQRGLENLQSKARDMAGLDSGPRTVGAIRAGSVEALRAEHSGGSTEKQLAEARKTAENTAEMIDLLRDIKAATAGNQLLEAT